MSQHQYYEFLAVDRALDEEDRRALRALSSRARITSTSFTNSYQWGDFRGDPAQLMARRFDLHLYLSNWGVRRLMIRWPERLIDRQMLVRCLADTDVYQRVVDGNLILDIVREELDVDEWDEDEEDARWLPAIAPLRSDVLAGDFRLFYLLWLAAVEAEAIAPETPEPLPGLGPMTEALDTFAEFFQIDGDLVAAAAERPFAPAIAPEAAREVIRALDEDAKDRFLMGLFEGSPQAAGELRALVRRTQAAAATPAQPRTVGELRARAEAIRSAREREIAARREAEARRAAEAAARARRARLDALGRRGPGVWDEIEAEIARRNASGYDRAAELLIDLQALAEEQGEEAEFGRRLCAIRARHATKPRLLERLQAFEDA